MQRKHADSLGQFDRKLEDFLERKKQKIDDFDEVQKALNEKIIDYVINSMRPLSTVDDPFFREIFNGKYLNYKCL